MVGHDLGDDAGDADLAGDRGGGVPVVTGHHHDLDAAGLEGCDRRRGAFLEGVGYSNDAGGVSVDRDQHRGLAFGGQPVVGGEQDGRVHPERVQQPTVADQHAPPVDPRHHPLAGDGLEPVDLGHSEPALGRPGHDRGRQRVLGGALDPGDSGQEAVLTAVGHGDDVGEGRDAAGQGAGLVEDDRLQLVGGLERFGGADQDAVRGPFAGADGDRHGSGEP